MITKFKQYNFDNIPKINITTDFEFKIAKAIIISLKRRKLLTQQQEDDCIDKLEKLYRI